MDLGVELDDGDLVVRRHGLLIDCSQSSLAALHRYFTSTAGRGGGEFDASPQIPASIIVAAYRTWRHHGSLNLPCIGEGYIEMMNSCCCNIWVYEHY